MRSSIKLDLKKLFFVVFISSVIIILLRSILEIKTDYDLTIKHKRKYNGYPYAEVVVDDKLMVLLKDEMFSDTEIESAFSKCPQYQCKISYDLSRRREAKALLVWLQFLREPNGQYGYTAYDNPDKVSIIRDHPGQLIIALAMESAGIYEFEGNSTLINTLFNITAGYPRVRDGDGTNGTHIYIPYGPIEFAGSDAYNHVSKFGELKEIPKKRNNSIVWIASNCWHEGFKRVDLVGNIMNQTKVDSYGTCLHNTELTEELESITDKGIQKLEILKKYTFVLSIENSLCEDYVTEKLWEPLSVGTIPIYLGASNIGEFLPSPDSIINIRDFNSIQELLEYVKQVENNESLRQKHLKWIKEPWSPNFKKIYKESTDNLDLLCTICKKMVSNDTFIPKISPFKLTTEKDFNLPPFPNK